VYIVPCCNAEGTLICLAVIIKCVGVKLEFSDGLPPGSKLSINPKSSHIFVVIFFLSGLKKRNCLSKICLILDDHSSHPNSSDSLKQVASFFFAQVTLRRRYNHWSVRKPISKQKPCIGRYNARSGSDAHWMNLEES